jgi:hypothetical protein
MPTPDFGIDISTFPDLDTSFTTITGFRVLAEAIARRFITPAGTLHRDPDYGFDVRALLNEKFTPADLYIWKRMMEAQAEEDERVRSADITLTLGADNRSIRIHCAIETMQGPFSMVLNVGQVRVELLEVTPG